MKIPTDTQQKSYAVIRAALEARLVDALKIDKKELPPLSIGDIVSLLFGLYGQTNSLGAYSGTMNGIVALIGQDALGERPTIEAPLVQ